MPKQILVFPHAAFSWAPHRAFAEDNRETDRRALLKVMHDIEQGINAPDIELMARQFDEKPSSPGLTRKSQDRTAFATISSAWWATPRAPSPAST